MNNCCLCKEINSKNSEDFFKIYPELSGYKTRVVLDTPNFIVIVDMAPISNHHLLIIPKFHYNSFCEIPSTLHYEFYFIIKIIRQTYNSEDILMFEHGSGSDNSIIKGCGNSVFHAHLHIIILLDKNHNFTLSGIKDNLLLAYDLTLKEFNDSNFLLKMQECNKNRYSYLFIKYKENHLLFVNSNNTNIESQFLRKYFLYLNNFKY